MKRCLASLHPTLAKNIYETENLSDHRLIHIDCRSINKIKINIFFGQEPEASTEITFDSDFFPVLHSIIKSTIYNLSERKPVNNSINLKLL
ncbi:hypothetical protein CXP54_03690 [Escherichia albertii]|nr:hypothetical protein CXP54_03690 [Escherichia albertii]EAB1451545.1 hypothetical protein [Escherichia albertii]EEW3330124.1 hypothetical protein [Escherichia albertii]EEW7341316.1 hypothetical protein [Escherichia albertii]KAF0953939.1 hypothetical protein AQU20_14010 [Escherichia albertii]